MGSVLFVLATLQLLATTVRRGKALDDMGRSCAMHGSCEHGVPPENTPLAPDDASTTPPATGRRLRTHTAKLGDSCNHGCWSASICSCSPMTCACGSEECDWECSELPENALITEEREVGCMEGF